MNFLLIWLQIFSVYNYIVLPIDTLSRDNYKNYYTENSHKDIMLSEYRSTFFTELEVGSPQQKIPFLVNMRTNDFVITSVHKMEKSGSEYYKNKDVYNFSPNFLKNYNFFNEQKSTSITYKNFESRAEKYKYDESWPIAEETSESNDIFYFYENIEMKNKKKENNIKFDLVKNIKDNITGIIGLSLFDDFQTKTSLLFVLKKNNITNDNFWFFDFDSPNDKKGKLIIGSTLEDIYKDKYSNKNLDIAYSTTKNTFWHIKFNKILKLLIQN